MQGVVLALANAHEAALNPTPLALFSWAFRCGLPGPMHPLAYLLHQLPACLPRFFLLLCLPPALGEDLLVLPLGVLVLNPPDDLLLPQPLELPEVR